VFSLLATNAVTGSEAGTAWSAALRGAGAFLLAGLAAEDFAPDDLAELDFADDFVAALVFFVADEDLLVAGFAADRADAVFDDDDLAELGLAVPGLVAFDLAELAFAVLALVALDLAVLDLAALVLAALALAVPVLAAAVLAAGLAVLRVATARVAVLRFEAGFAAAELAAGLVVALLTARSTCFASASMRRVNLSRSDCFAVRLICVCSVLRPVLKVF
jgi:hypothetical protein